MTNLIRSAVCVILASAACADSPQMAPAPTLDSISVGMSFTSQPKQFQLGAIGRYSSGPGRALTNEVAWKSSNPEVATVSATGLLTNVGDGATTVTATYQAKSGSMTLMFPLPNND